MMDSSAFDIFSWKMLYGDPHTALVAPASIVLTRSVAEKFFGKQFGHLFLFFSCLSIFIACLGLFGLSVFMAQQRIKEIGIRKVLGSSQKSIVFLLSKDFVKLICIALLISVPICWWVMADWLQGFAYRIPIGPLVFLESGVIALGIALATMTWQSLRAAMANPIRSLRNE
jgi:putative ABC transport system permease protein